MSQTVNFDEIPDSTLLPKDMYNFEVESLEDTTSRAGNRMFKGTFRVSEGPYEGVPVFDYFTIGNEGDREAKLQETWNTAPGSKRLKRMLKALLIPMTGTIEEIVERAQSQHFIGSVDQQVDQSEGQYKGSKKNVIQAFHPVGSRAIAGGAAPSAPAAVARPATRTGGVQTISCPYCSDSLPRAEYANHKKLKHPDEE